MYQNSLDKKIMNSIHCLHSQLHTNNLTAAADALSKIEIVKVAHRPRFVQGDFFTIFFVSMTSSSISATHMSLRSQFWSLRKL